MDTIKPEDRQKIQAHLTEIWKILYANGLEDKEHQRTPSSKQKERMSQMLITYNKDHSTLTEGFQLLVSTHDTKEIQNRR